MSIRNLDFLFRPKSIAVVDTLGVMRAIADPDNASAEPQMFLQRGNTCLRDGYKSKRKRGQAQAQLIFKIKFLIEPGPFPAFSYFFCYFSSCFLPRKSLLLCTVMR